MRFNIFYISFILFLILAETNVFAQVKIDTIKAKKPPKASLDSLKNNAEKKEITKLLFDLLYTERDTSKKVAKKQYSRNYYQKHSGKKIVFINVRSINVFAKSLKDSTNKQLNWFEKIGNKLHTSTNLRSIKRLLLFSENDTVSPIQFYESERLIRALPYIKEIKIAFEVNKNNPNEVGVYVVTKDRFSWGGSVNVSPFKSAKLELYNKNILGRGHEISFSLLGNTKINPHIGFETFYSLSNIKGRFIDATLGYMNHYKEKGVYFDVTKPFITSSIKWGYNLTGLRMTRAYAISHDHPVRLEKPINLLYLNGWIGYSFDRKHNESNNYQIATTAGFFKQHFYSRPKPDDNNKQFFYNGTFYLAGLTFSQRRYVQDALVYSYGIIEDIPEGFKKEIVVGYEDNEFGDRYYGHILISNGNILRKKLSYLNVSAGFSGFFNNKSFTQGLIQSEASYISKLYNLKRNKYRIFVKTRYKLGIRRFDIENLYLNRDQHIRGFRSTNPQDKQRLSLNLEYTYFIKKQFYKFNMALFSFYDMGIIGSNQQIVFKGDYYHGLGIGVRVHNENLVFRTLQVRLAFYPYTPKGMALADLLLDEQSKRRFHNYEPSGPIPLRFE